MHDLDGDGIPEWVVNSWSRESPLLAWKLSSEMRKVELKVKKNGKWKKQMIDKKMPTLQRITIGSKHNGHGLGFGDINGDGLEDILFEAGWYERPAENAMTSEWKVHLDWKEHASVPMLCRDMNKDGKMDIIIGQGHDFGLDWWEQLPSKEGKTQWKIHKIDHSFSQAHALLWADLDNDGEDELITGKRYYAHNGKDPGGEELPGIYYYTWNQKKLEFTRHTIEIGTVGIGLQIRTADMNNDGRIDIAVAGKTGTYILFNKGF